MELSSTSLTYQDVTTISRMKSLVGRMRDLYYDVVELVAPYLIQLEHIIVLHKNKVMRERLVTLKGVHNIRILLLNSIDALKPIREYKFEILSQFPSCGPNGKKLLNLSKYLAETWSLIKFIQRMVNKNPVRRS